MNDSAFSLSEQKHAFSKLSATLVFQTNGTALTRLQSLRTVWTNAGGA